MVVALYPSAKAALSKELCRRRKFFPSVLPYFTEEGTRILELPDCSYLAEEDLLDAFDKCKGPQLDSVKLNFCGRGMSDEVFATLSEGSVNIRDLRLEGCYRLTDDGFRKALRNFKRLEILELSSCTKITGGSIDAVIEACGDTLHSLSIDQCPQLTSIDLALLAQLQQLERLIFRIHTHSPPILEAYPSLSSSSTKRTG